jgi:hypothetical protein
MMTEAQGWIIIGLIFGILMEQSNDSTAKRFFLIGSLCSYVKAIILSIMI